MVETWVVLTIIAAIMLSVKTLIDKFVLSHEMKDPIIATVVSGIVVFILFAGYGFYLGKIQFLSPYLMMFTIFSGVLYSVATYFYYISVERGEASRVASFFSIIPILTLVLAFIFLNERLEIINYFGIVLVVIGSILISLKRENKKLIVSGAFFIMMLSALFFALRDLIIKVVTIQADIGLLFFWIGVGSLFPAVFLLMVHHPHLKKKIKKGLEHILISRIFSATGILFFSIAISLTSVSVVSALLRTEIVFVFILATLISKFHPKIISEKITFPIILQKIVSIALILFGAFLLI